MRNRLLWVEKTMETVKMKIPLVACLIVVLMHQDTTAVITTSEDDFVVDCGTTPGGPVNITYTNPRPGTNNIEKMYSLDDLASCSDNDANADNEYTIADVRADCTISNLSSAEYQIEITLQEVPFVVQSTDPTFLINCMYTVGGPVLTITEQGTLIGGARAIKTIPVTIPADQTYQIDLLDYHTKVATSVARFGDPVTLRVLMGGTDDDENGVQVKQLNITSGAVNLNLIDNYCVAEPYIAVFLQDGFLSVGEEATFPLTLFALEGAQSNVITFTAELTICPTSCDGTNCPAPGKRKRRSSEDDTSEDESLLLSTKLYILPASVKLPSVNHSTEESSNALTCMRSLGFTVTVTVLGVLLLVAMVTAVFMFTTRRRKQQKQGA